MRETTTKGWWMGGWPLQQITTGWEMRGGCEWLISKTHCKELKNKGIIREQLQGAGIRDVSLVAVLKSLLQLFFLYPLSFETLRCEGWALIYLFLPLGSCSAQTGRLRCSQCAACCQERRYLHSFSLSYSEYRKQTTSPPTVRLCPASPKLEIHVQIHDLEDLEGGVVPSTGLPGR